MINYTKRLDSAIRTAAWAHEQQGQHRKGTEIPYIIHPFGAMIIASNATTDEDVLIACLLHDVLEDVDHSIYGRNDMQRDFGERVAKIVDDVTKDASIRSWHKQSKAYLDHLENQASDEAVIVSAADKIHNLLSTVKDYQTDSGAIWQRFATKNRDDQIWWYQSILDVIKRRQTPKVLSNQLQDLLDQINRML